jgi:tetratricopeptide (TPR) repeat protein
MGKSPAEQFWLTQPKDLQQQPQIATSSELELQRQEDLPLARLDEAEARYRQALGIAVELGDRPDVARASYQLGVVARLRGRLDEAEGWYRQALGIAVELGDRPNMALVSHQLGIVTQSRGRLEDAGDRYQRKLAPQGARNPAPETVVASNRKHVTRGAKTTPAKENVAAQAEPLRRRNDRTRTESFLDGLAATFSFGYPMRRSSTDAADLLRQAINDVATASRSVEGRGV